MSRNHRRGLVEVVLLLAASTFAAAQTPPAGRPAPSLPLQAPMFKAAVEYVEVDALVTDAEGNLVRDLTADDFQLFEDGRPQTIATFTLVDIPVERPDRPFYSDETIEPDVASNERPFGGRVYVLILDDLHTDSARSQRVKTASREFIEEHLGANDLMAVLYTGGRGDAGQEFTSNKRLLIDAVDKFVGRKLPSATLERNEIFFRQQSFPTGFQESYIADPYESERAHNAESTLQVLRKVGDWFSGVRGRRKTILLMSEGIDYDISDIVRNPSAPSRAPVSAALSIVDAIRTAVASTARSNVSIYAIDPRGLTGLGEDTISQTSFADIYAQTTNLDGEPADVQSPASGISMTALLNEFRLSQNNLRDLADETNGFAILNSNDYAEAFDRIVRDNSSYYVLAYYPEAASRDGKFHDIDVRVTRPGLTIRARRGYVAPKGDDAERFLARESAGVTSPEMRDALDSPLPVSGLGMRAFASPFRGTAPNASVLLGVELVGADLSLVDSGRLDLSYFALDSKGVSHGFRSDSLTLNLRPETRSRVRQSGLRIFNRMDLPPGRYQIRVASGDPAGGLVGSVVYDLEVPDFSTPPLAMSGLVLTSMFGSMMVTARADEALRTALPAPAAALRTFPRNDEIALFVEIYDNERTSTRGLDVTTRVRSDEGQVFLETAQHVDAETLRAAGGVHGYTARVPLADLRPGPYVLTVEANASDGGAAASRDVRFWVTLPAVPTW